MKTIPLTKGAYAIVDDVDYPELSKHKWTLHHCDSRYGYAVRGVGPKKKRSFVFMHRQIIGAGPGCEVDHVNNNSLDNRRNNLRLCTRRENSCNNRKRMGTSSRYIGVHFHSKAKKWQATIWNRGAVIYLGLFDSEKEAALARDYAAKKHYGQFAKLNFDVAEVA